MRKAILLFVIIGILIPFLFVSCFLDLVTEDVSVKVSNLLIESTGDNTIRASWEEPEEIGDIEGYVVRIISGDGAVVERWVPVGSTSYSEAVEEGDYSVAVQVVNNAGARSESATSDSGSIPIISEAISPDIPTNILVFPEYNTGVVNLSISWNQPSYSGTDHGGLASSIASYTVYWAEGDGVGTASPQSVEIMMPATSSVLYDLVEGEMISFIVVAKNVAGLISDPTEVITIDLNSNSGTIPVSDVTTQLDGLLLTVSWTAPAETKDIEGYVITYIYDDGSDPIQEIVRTVNAPETSYSEGFSSGTYTISVQSKSIHGVVSTAVEPATGPVFIDTLASPPTAASNIVKLDGSVANQLSIQWSNSVDGTLEDGNAASTVYRVFYAPSENANTVADVIAANEATITAITENTLDIKGLVGAGSYDIVVQAVNAEIPILSSNSEKEVLVSDGVGSVKIQYDGSDAGNSISLPLNFDTVDLTASVESIGVSEVVNWASDTPEVATIDSSGTVTFVSKGEAVITVTSVADTAKSDSIILRVSDKTLSIYTLDYADGLKRYTGISSTFDIQTSTIPNDADSVYSIVDSSTQTTVNGISINYQTGSITASASVLTGTYDMTVTVLSSSSNYVDSTSTAVSIEVLPDLLSYKTDASAVAQNYFTIGDIDYKHLYKLSGLSDTSNTTASIELVRVATSGIIYQESIQSLYQEDGSTYFGPQTMSYATFSAIPNGADIRITVTVNDNGSIYNKETLVVTKNEANIYTWWDLQGMQHNLAGDYSIQENITFPTPGTKGFPSAGFTPIGKDTDYDTDGFQGTSFTGTLDGNSKSISDLYINDVNMTFAGLFGQIQLSGVNVLRDITFVNPDITAKAVIGVVAGALDQGTITGVGVEGASASVRSLGNTDAYADGIGAYLGGLVGIVNTDGTLSGYSHTKVEGSIGGNISIYNQYVGGLIGYSNGRVTGYATGSVTGEEAVGGLIGKAHHNSYTIGYAKGDVTAKLGGGGLLGYSFGQATGFATGDVMGTASSTIGGLIGVTYATISGYATGNVIALDGEKKDLSGIGLGYSNNPDDNLYGYTLGYVMGNTLSNCTNTFQSIFSSNFNGVYLIGRTETEANAGEEHMNTCETNISGNAITESLSGATGSRSAASFSGFPFGTGVGEWTAADSTTAHSWPILNFPADFPGGKPVQNPTIGTPPEGYQQ